MDHLKELLKDNDTIYCVLRHVNSTGSRRKISFKLIKDNYPLTLDYYIGEALGYKLDKHQGLIVNGGGMDMGFSVVSNLAMHLNLKLRSEWI